MELTIISGKGGTGKTMIAVALAALFVNAVKVDCDVDAPNLYLYYGGADIKKESFYSSKKASIDNRFCTHCGICESVCRFEAIKDAYIDEINCEGCGACVMACPEKAINLNPQKNADIYLTRTPAGMLSRAKMMAGRDGSGKLITQLRKNARRFLEKDNIIINDGSPGIGCPVIASITATDLVLLVAEPTLSGIGDLKRVAELCMHFGIQTLACVNKYDINYDITEEIRSFCQNSGITLVGKIPYDDSVMQSINELKPITEYPNSAAGRAIMDMWVTIKSVVSGINQRKIAEIDENMDTVW
jgi:MinD superfamily P-loop ATPase